MKCKEWRTNVDVAVTNIAHALRVLIVDVEINANSNRLAINNIQIMQKTDDSCYFTNIINPLKCIRSLIWILLLWAKHLTFSASGTIAFIYGKAGDAFDCLMAKTTDSIFHGINRLKYQFSPTNNQRFVSFLLLSCRLT